MNQLFAGLYYPILSITKMSCIPPAPCRNLQDIVQAKIPKTNPQDATEREKFVIGPGLLGYLKIGSNG
jgi:hypothetical protein